MLTSTTERKQNKLKRKCNSLERINLTNVYVTLHRIALISILGLI